MADMLNRSIEWPALPMTVLLAVCCLYWALVILGLFDLDLFDFDLDADFEVHSPVGIGFLGLRFLNIGNVPVMLWASVFALSGWLSSMLLDQPLVDADWRQIAAAVGRNVAIALVATKVFTNPLRGRFDPVEPNRSQDLIGRQCVVTSTTASADFGQARLDTEAAPLILNVRSLDAELPRHSVAEIVDYLPESNIYIIEPADTHREA